MGKINRVVMSIASLFTTSGIIRLGGIAHLVDVDSKVILSNFSNEDYLLPVTFEINSNPDYGVALILINNETGEVIQKERIDLISNAHHNDGEYSFHLPLSEHLSSTGLRVDFLHYLRTKIEEKYTGSIYPFKKETINTSYYRNEPYVRKGVLLAIENGRLYTDEVFDFTNLNEYLSLNSNNKLDLTNLRFNYKGFGELTCGSVYLKIKDYKNLFPNLNKLNGEVSLKMDYTQIGNEIQLSINERLYVNYETLEMSSEELDGYHLTDSFYLPFGKEEMMQEDEIYISIKDAGYSLTDFIIPFNFYMTNKYFGECYDSDFCISGGIKK